MASDLQAFVLIYRFFYFICLFAGSTNFEKQSLKPNDCGAVSKSTKTALRSNGKEGEGAERNI